MLAICTDQLVQSMKMCTLGVEGCNWQINKTTLSNTVNLY